MSKYEPLLPQAEAFIRENGVDVGGLQSALGVDQREAVLIVCMLLDRNPNDLFVPVTHMAAAAFALRNAVDAVNLVDQLKHDPRPEGWLLSVRAGTNDESLDKFDAAVDECLDRVMKGKDGILVFFSVVLGWIKTLKKNDAMLLLSYLRHREPRLEKILVRSNLPSGLDGWVQRVYWLARKTPILVENDDFSLPFPPIEEIFPMVKIAS